MTVSLFDPVKLGSLDLPNRIIMAPLTRGRAGETAIPNDMMVTYYSQRAGAGLIVAEATAISRQGYGWLNAPGIYNDDQVAGWKKVTDAVHQAGGRIILQLWHMGRVSHSTFQEGGELPVAPSAIAADGEVNTPDGKQAYETPHALSVSEIKSIVNDYVLAARRAMQAGFDGVEVHAANGYLIDQFLRDGSNKRDDEYGGSIENRTRFLMEVLEAVTKEVGADKTGVRISPRNPFNSMSDSDPIKTFSVVAEKLNSFDLAYLHVVETTQKGHRMYAEGERVTPHIRKVYKGNLIVNGGYTKDSGNAALADSQGDAVCYGVPFIANPDLVERFKQDAPLNKPDMNTFYTAGEKGYIDYPSLQQDAA